MQASVCTLCHAHVHRSCARLASYRSEQQSKKGLSVREGWEGMHVGHLMETQGTLLPVC